MDESVFYVVWNPAAGNPRYQHDDEERALAEAERLAGANPGQRFYVMQAVSVSTHKTVATTRLSHQLPF